MAKSKLPATTDSSGLAVSVYSDAIATGEDSLTSVKATMNITDHGQMTHAKGMVITMAAAESSDGNPTLASTLNDLTTSGADKVIIKTNHLTGTSDDGTFDITITKFKAIDNDHKDGGTLVIQLDKEKDGLHADLDLDGNLSTLNFHVEANGHDSLAEVDAFALTIEDELSIATLLMTGATDG